MRSAPSEALPALAPLTDIRRPMSTPEYYHASIGTHARTLEPARKIVAVLEGDHAISIDRWHAALDAVSAVNPGLRLRLHGHRRATRSLRPMSGWRVFILIRLWRSKPQRRVRGFEHTLAHFNNDPHIGRHTRQQ